MIQIKPHRALAKLIKCTYAVKRCAQALLNTAYSWTANTGIVL